MSVPAEGLRACMWPSCCPGLSWPSHAPQHARMHAAQVEVALSNSFGFGGHNSAVVFKAYKP